MNNPFEYLESCMLKTYGAIYNVRVTLSRTPENRIVYFMRGVPYYSYKNASRFLRMVVETESVPTGIMDTGVQS